MKFKTRFNHATSVTLAWVGYDKPARIRRRALLTGINLSLGRRPSQQDWRRPPGRPPNRWPDQIRTDAGSPPATARRNAIGYAIIRERRNDPSWLRDNDIFFEQADDK